MKINIAVPIAFATPWTRSTQTWWSISTPSNSESYSNPYFSQHPLVPGTKGASMEVETEDCLDSTLLPSIKVSLLSAPQIQSRDPISSPIPRVTITSTSKDSPSMSSSTQLEMCFTLDTSKDTAWRIHGEGSSDQMCVAISCSNAEIKEFRQVGQMFTAAHSIANGSISPM